MANNAGDKSAVVAKTGDGAAAAKPKDRQMWRDLTAYWILGLCG